MPTAEPIELDWRELQARFAEERRRGLIEAQAMILAFESVGVGSFGVTRKAVGYRTPKYRKYTTGALLAALEGLLVQAAGNQESLIVRPFYKAGFDTLSHADHLSPSQRARVNSLRRQNESWPRYYIEREIDDLEHPKAGLDESAQNLPGPTRAIVQIDDIDLDRARQLAPFSFCIIETSPRNYQAFVCVSDCTDYERLRRGINTASNADKGATCAARLAGTYNTKPRHKQIVKIRGRVMTPGVDDYLFPQVRLVHVVHERMVKTDELRAAGLLIDIAPTKLSLPPVQGPIRRRQQGGRVLPSYEMSLRSAPLKTDGTPDRSRADFRFALRCLQWNPPLTRDEIFMLLMEHSEKAREKGEGTAEQYVRDTIDAAMKFL